MAIKVGQKRKTSYQLAQDVTVSATGYDTLLKYLLQLAQSGKTLRNSYIDRLKLVDKEIYGFMQHDAGDEQRERDNAAGRGIKPTDTSLPLIFSQMDEASTIMLQMLAPDKGMYQAMATKDKQAIAKGFSTLMNEHGEYFGHYRHFALGILYALRYNISGWGIEWQQRFGNKITNEGEANRRVSVERGLVMEGNAMSALDPYNTLFDGSLDSIVDTPFLAEFYATLRTVTPFRIRRMVQNGEIFNAEAYVIQPNDPNAVIPSILKENSFYEPRPSLNVLAKYARHMEGGASSFGADFWFDTLSAGTYSPTQTSLEEMTIYARIVPSDFGIKVNNLAAESSFQIWRFTVLNGQTIVRAQRLTNAHDLLPCGITQPLEDGFGLQTKSLPEHLIPMQRFASHQFNIHQKSSRKSLYGLTFFDGGLFPSLNEDDADLISGKFAMDPTAAQNLDDIRKKVLQINDTPNTDRLMGDVENAVGIMQNILPTDQLKQVTDLQRATKHQSAATVQGVNRRHLKTAKIIEAQAMGTVRFMQMYNIFEYQKDTTIITDQGEEQQIAVADFRETKMMFLIGDGLRGLDSLILTDTILQLTNSVLQSQIAGQQIDVVALMNYLTTLIGDNFDLAAFKYQSEVDKLPKEQRDMAFQLLQQAMQQQQQQNGGTPANAPAGMPAGMPAQ